MRSAAIYARISSDVSGEKLGVARQLEDCRKLAEDRGWQVGDEYVDNDISAYSGKPRPEYLRMLADLESGARDAVIVYNLDRLHRIPSELEDFISLCDQVGMHEVATVTADIDLGNDDGLFMARIFAAFAAKESGRKSARGKRKARQSAEAGLPHGPNRPFGYEDDKVTIRDSEAEIIRELVNRLIAGESMRSLTTWMNSTETPTVLGAARWRTTTVKSVICSARIAGLRTHNGEVIGPGIWEPIITVEQREQVLARFAEKARSGRRAPRTYLLSGLLRCGRCDTPLMSSTKHKSPDKKVRRYICFNGPDRGGCGRLTVVAEPVEDLLKESAFIRLDSDELRQAWEGRVKTNPDLAQLNQEIEEDTRALTELAELYAARPRRITAAEWMAARDPIEARIRDARRTIANVTDSTGLSDLIGRGEILREQWPDLLIDRRQAIIKATLRYAVITPGTPGARSLDINRVQPLWRE
ncbi:recombinase family protein [Nocardia vinacea]|uniref:recombinase family protein n=1 Tax=Nocardia vinacea TaxID=96468 RepID=UPI003434C847